MTTTDEKAKVEEGEYKPRTRTRTHLTAATTNEKAKVKEGEYKSRTSAHLTATTNHKQEPEKKGCAAYLHQAALVSNRQQLRPDTQSRLPCESRASVRLPEAYAGTHMPPLAKARLDAEGIEELAVVIYIKVDQESILLAQLLERAHICFTGGVELPLIAHLVWPGVADATNHLLLVGGRGRLLPSAIEDYGHAKLLDAETSTVHIVVDYDA